jgi:hypothetical protein
VRLLSWQWGIGYIGLFTGKRRFYYGELFLGSQHLKANEQRLPNRITTVDNIKKIPAIGRDFF